MPWFPMQSVGGAVMPYVKTRIVYSGRGHRCRFLVDTGAALSMAPLDFASILVGEDVSDLTKWPRRTLPLRISSGSGGEARVGLSLTVSLQLDGLEPVQEALWFVDGWSYYLLGHRSWFAQRGATFPTQAQLPRRLRDQGRHFAIY